MVDVAHGINKNSKIKRSMSSSLKYLQSKRVAQRNRDTNVVWELPKYVLLMAILAVGVSYSSCASPQRGLWSDKDGAHLADGSVLRDTYLRSYRALLYHIIAAFSVAFVPSNVIVSSLRWCLCILGIFCIMVLFRAVLSCCTLAISQLIAPNYGNKVASEARETVLQHTKLHQMVVLASLCFNIMLYLAVLTRPKRRTVMGHGHGFCSRALWVCSGAALIGLTSVFAVRSLTTSICFSALVVFVLFCIGLLAFLVKPVENQGRNTEETQRKCWKQWDTGESEHHRDPALSDPQGILHVADQHLQKPGMYLLLIATLVATITYQAGLNPPGGFWEADATGGLRHYRAGDPILHTTYPRMYQASFYCNTTAFVASLAFLILLVSMICRTRGIKNCALQVALIMKLIGLIRTRANRSCSESDLVVDKHDTNSPIKGTPLDATWRVACAAPHHMTGNKSLMLTGSYMPVHGGEVITVHPGTNGEAVPLQVQGSGSVRTESITLEDVWYVPGLDSNLVSTGQLARQGCAISLGHGGCRITRGGALVGNARFTEASQFELDFLKVA